MSKLRYLNFQNLTKLWNVNEFTESHTFVHQFRNYLGLVLIQSTENVEIWILLFENYKMIYYCAFPISFKIEPDWHVFIFLWHLIWMQWLQGFSDNLSLCFWCRKIGIQVHRSPSCWKKLQSWHSNLSCMHLIQRDIQFSFKSQLSKHSVTLTDASNL